MDERAFQLELRELKQRVTDIANTSQPLAGTAAAAAQLSSFMLTSALHNDFFVAQLRDVKLRIDRMQASLPQQWQNQVAQSHRIDDRTQDTNDISAEHDRDTGRLTNLQENLESVNERVCLLELSSKTNELADLRDASFDMHERITLLEHAVQGPWKTTRGSTSASDTTQRILALEQTVRDLTKAVREFTFTPDCSETGAEDLEASKEAYDACAMGESSNSTTPDGAAIPEQLRNSSPTTFSQALEVLQQDPAIHSIQFTQQETDGTGDSGTSSQVLATAAKPEFGRSPEQLPEHDDDMDEESRAAASLPALLDERTSEELPFGPNVDDFGNLDKTYEKKGRLLPDHKSAMAEKDAAIKAQEQQIKDLELVVQQRNYRLHEYELQMDHARNASIQNRNAEIDKREEHINALRHALHKKESTVAHLQQRLSVARQDCASMGKEANAHREAKDEAVRRLTHNLKECEASRHHFMTKYVDENYRFKVMQQRKLQDERQMQEVHSEYTRSLENARKHHEAQMKNALSSRDEELDKLNAFCRDNEAILYQQEEIIARGGMILEQRDAEIDRLHQKLKESQQEKRYLRDHGAKLRSILQDRDEEIKDLKWDVKDEKDLRMRLEVQARKDSEAIEPRLKDVRFSSDGSQITEPLKQAAEALSGGGRRPLESSWSPQPIRESRVLPHEESRRRVWEGGDVALSLKPRFGSTSPITERPKIPNHRNARNARRDLDRIDKNDRYKRREDAQNGLDISQQGAHADRIDTHSNISGHASDVNSNFKGMEAQARTNDEHAENHRHALPLDVTRWPPLPARTAAVERAGSVPDLRAGVQSEATERHGAKPKPASSMLDLRPGNNLKESQYHPPSVETEAETDDERRGSSLLD